MASRVEDEEELHIVNSLLSSLRLILKSLRRICEYGSNIAEVVLNLTAVEPQEP